MRYLTLFIFLFSLFIDRGLSQEITKTDTFSVFFETDVYDRFDVEKIIQFADTTEELLLARVFGYADYVGDAEANQLLSEQRANAVAKALGNHKKIKIKQLEGNGEVSSSKKSADGNANDRRVDVIVTRTIVVPEKAKALPTPEDDTYDITSENTENIVLEGLSFIPGRHYPTPDAMPVLEKLVKTMKKYPELHIEIQGHICCAYNVEDGMDNDTGEMTLSKNRAKFVYDFLVEHGIDKARLAYVGLGSSQPKVYPEATDSDRQANRRVEMKIIKN
ncbi:MAG: OmpA family protein [Salibacteraceae bacterium]